MTDFLTNLRTNQRLSTWLQYGIVGVMMACVAVSLSQVGRAILPSVEGNFPILLAFLFALEAFSAHQIRKNTYFPDPEWFAFHITEWVVLLVVIKVFQYLAHGAGYFWAEVQSWRVDFFASFFNSEFLFALLVTLVVWVISLMLAEPLDALRVDENRLKIEEEVGISEERAAARRQVVDTVLFVGVLMVLVTSLLRNDLTARWFNLPAMRLGAVNLAVYFALGLALLSLTQFTVLQFRWGVNKVTISPRLASRWAQYGLIFVLLLAGMALILPTGYARNVLAALNWVLQALIALLLFIFQLLTLPFLFVAGLLGLLAGEPPPLDIEPPAPPPVEQIPQVPLEFPEAFRTVLITALILALLFYSFYSYARARRGQLAGIPRQGITGWLAWVWAWIAAWLGGAGRMVLQTVREGVRRLARPSQSSDGASAWRYIGLRRLTPRQRVMFYYLAFVRRGGESGAARQPSQTPYEYARSLSAVMGQEEPNQGTTPAPGEDIRLITESFVEAQYSRHEITAAQADQVRSIWERLRRLFRRLGQRK